MTPPATQTQPDPIDDTTLAVIVRSTMDAIAFHPDAGPDERVAVRHAAYIAIRTLGPRDVLEAMLAARITVAHFHLIDSMRRAAQDDMPAYLRLRYRSNAGALTRMLEAAKRELDRCQALPARQPAALPVAMPAARPQPAPVSAPSAPAQHPVHATPSQAAAGQRPTAAPRPATGRFHVPTQAEIEELIARVEKGMPDLTPLAA
jgi:hypothetical protein